MSGAGGGKNPEPDARQGQEAEAALLAMPQLTRDIFIARHFHGHSIADICRQTGLSQRQVMGHLRRAVDHLCMAFPNCQSGQSRSGEGGKAALRSRAELAYQRARANRIDGTGPNGRSGPLDPTAIAAMNDALLRLFCRERTVFLAMRVDHFSIDEIAERMGLSYDEALRIFIRAFRNLERNLASPRRHWWRRWIGWPGLG